jgi:hypothetical protein
MFHLFQPFARSFEFSGWRFLRLLYGKYVMQVAQNQFPSGFDSAWASHARKRLQHGCISVYVLVAIIKKRHDIKADLYTILQVLSLTLFEKTSIEQVLNLRDRVPEDHGNPKQLDLFDNLTGH